MALEVDCKPSLGEYTAPFEFLFRPGSARGFTLFRRQDVSEIRKELDLYYKWRIICY